MKRTPTLATVAAHVAALAPTAEAASVALDRLHPLPLARMADAATAQGRDVAAAGRVQQAAPSDAREKGPI